MVPTRSREVDWCRAGSRNGQIALIVIMVNRDVIVVQVCTDPTLSAWNREEMTVLYSSLD